MTEEEMKKERILTQANLYLQGLSLRQVAAETNQSHVAVKNNFENKLKEYDIALYYKVMTKLAENQEKSIEDDGVRNRVLKAYELLVESEINIAEIAAILNSTEMTIYRDLTVRLKKYHEIDPDSVTDEMLAKVSDILTKHSLYNSPYIHDDVFDINLLSILYPTEEKRKKFIVNCALAFGLRIDALSEILGMDKEQLYAYLIDNNEYCKKSLIFMFNHGFAYQEKAKALFKSFFIRLSKAYLAKDFPACNEILKEISDKEAIDFKKKHVHGAKISDEEILIVLRYQLKYCLSADMVCKTFHISRTIYILRVRSFADKYPEMISAYDYLCDYYAGLYKGR